MSKKIEYEKYFNYDYNNISAILQCIIETNGEQLYLAQLKQELNKVFCNNKCIEVLYTSNTDKLFFGMCVLPIISNKTISKLLLNDDPDDDKIEEYYIEIDSKLNNPILEFTGMHLTSILLYEIGNIIINDKVLNEFKYNIDEFCAKNREVLDRGKAQTASVLFSFAAFDTIKKLYSFFYRDLEEIYIDNFSSMCGFGTYLEQAYECINTKGFTINKNIKNILLVLQWVLDIYKEFSSSNIYILRKLNDAKFLSPSILEKKLINTTITNMGISLDVINSLNESMISESNNKNSIFSKFSRSGMRAMESELYELKIQAKSTNDKDGCLYVLRLINTRLGIVDEYLASHKEELSNDDITRWSNLYQEYCALREELTSKKVFGTKIYGLFTDYTKLPPSYSFDMNNVDYMDH